MQLSNILGKLTGIKDMLILIGFQRSILDLQRIPQITNPPF